MTRCIIIIKPVYNQHFISTENYNNAQKSISFLKKACVYGFFNRCSVEKGYWMEVFRFVDIHRRWIKGDKLREILFPIW